MPTNYKQRRVARHTVHVKRQISFTKEADTAVNNFIDRFEDTHGIRLEFSRAVNIMTIQHGASR